MVHTYKRILFSFKKEWNSDACYMNLENIMLREVSQDPKGKYNLISLHIIPEIVKSTEIFGNLQLWLRGLRGGGQGVGR